MRAKLVPVYFKNPLDADFVKQLNALRSLFAQDADLLEPLALGASLPEEADAVIFPQMLGEAYRRHVEFKALDLPILVITSEFGTVSMWDWEINTYLAADGIRVLAPNSLEQARKFIKACALKRELRSAKLLVYQDNPGEGFQADIFKRFYWWEQECIDRLENKFGVGIEKKSFKRLSELARQIPDADAQA